MSRRHLGSRSGGIARVLALVGALAAAQVLAAPPAGAHGVHSPGQLPYGAWELAWLGVAVVLIGWSLLALISHRPWLSERAEGRPLPDLLQRSSAVLRWGGAAFGVAVWLSVVLAGLAGSAHAASNLSPLAMTLAFWVGVSLASAVLGDVWSLVDPLRTFAGLVERRSPSPPVRHSFGRETRWLPLVGAGGFFWLELASPWRSSPRAWSAALLGYTVVMVGLSRRRGGREWLGRADGFAVLFAAMGRAGAFARREDGVLVVRPPLAELCARTTSAGAVGPLLVTLGALMFDGLSGTAWWRSQTSAGGRVGRSLFDSAGLLLAIVTVVAVWVVHGATGPKRASGERGPRSPRLKDVAERSLMDAAVLVPISLAWIAAHSISPIVFDGQNLIVQASDPLGKGWDLFGTGDWSLHYQALGASGLARLQLLVLAVGHLAAAVVGHDLALARYGPRAGLHRLGGTPLLLGASMATAVFLLVGA